MPFILSEFKFISPHTRQSIIFPLRLPKYVYADLLHLKPTEDFMLQLIVILVVIVFNILLYGGVIYIGLSLLKKMKRNTIEKKSENPPNPPIF